MDGVQHSRLQPVECQLHAAVGDRIPAPDVGEGGEELGGQAIKAILQVCLLGVQCPGQGGESHTLEVGSMLELVTAMERGSFLWLLPATAGQGSRRSCSPQFSVLCVLDKQHREVCSQRPRIAQTEGAPTSFSRLDARGRMVLG